MRRAGLLLAALAVLLPARAHAADAGTPDAADAASSDAGAPDADPNLLVPPAPIEMPPIALPEGAPAPTEIVEVAVLLTIDATGAVAAVELTRAAGAPYDDAVVAGAQRFRFRPARQGGKPLAVRIPFTQRFEPPPPPKPAVIETDALLEGVVVSKGARTPVAGATVLALDRARDRRYLTTTQTGGVFQLPVPSGRALEVQIAATQHEKFVQREELARDQRLTVKYLIERRNYGEYEFYVRAASDRTEVSRTTLSGRELTRAPGTFGDPFRVVNLLPGVTTVMSLLPMPIVRGSSPGNTGILLDGVRLPLLYHLLAGPSVIHPEFLDRVDFYPGGFPVPYGGYTAGIVDGVTRAARPDERRIDFDLTLTQTGVFLREPLPSVAHTVTAAGRIGYPGVLISLLSPDVYLSYWDYQVRADGARGPHAWSLFFYGAGDNLKVRPNPEDELEEAANLSFHRIDLRYRHGSARNGELVRLVFGYDDTTIHEVGDDDVVPSNTPNQPPMVVSSENAFGNGVWSVTPELRLDRGLGETLDLTLGAQSIIRRVKQPDAGRGELGEEARTALRLSNPDGFFTTSSLFLQLAWKPTDRLRLIPGVRADVYDQRREGGAVTEWSIDPRVLARIEVHPTLWLKGVVGRYHQPPRLFLPLPGLDASSLELGLLASTQYSVGAELRLGTSVEIDASAYYNDMDPILFDLSLPEPDEAPSTVELPQGVAPTLARQQQTEEEDPTISRFFAPQRGRAYGLEVLIRKRDTERFYGWLAYTLSRSERRRSYGWEPFDFDRSHILNLVAGIRLPRNWEFSARLLFQTGTPLYNESRRAIGRTDGQFRFDLRIDKRAVWNRWLFDFYVDIINATVAEESGGLVGDDGIRYLIPTVGFRALF